LGNSSLYLYSKDRLATGEEHMLLQGWDMDFTADNIAEPITGLNKHYVDCVNNLKGGVSTQRKQQRRQSSVVLREMAGSALFLNDIGMLMKISYLAQTGDMYERGPPKIAEVAASARAGAAVLPIHSMAAADIEADNSRDALAAWRCLADSDGEDSWRSDEPEDEDQRD